MAGIPIWIRIVPLLSTKLIVEVDGDVHEQQAEADSERERILRGYGFSILRLKNDEVLRSSGSCARKVQVVCRSFRARDDSALKADVPSPSSAFSGTYLQRTPRSEGELCGEPAVLWPAG
jgi:hypothetical protein